MEDSLIPFEFIDSKELEGIQSFKCKFCENDISLMPFVCDLRNENKKFSNLYFCDVICAKLYSLDNNLNIESFDKQKYDEYYKNNLLTKQAMEFYNFLRKLNLNLFPRIQTDSSKLNPVSKKSYYIYYLKNYILQALS